MSSLPRLEILIEELLGNRLGAGVYRRWVRDLGLRGDERVLDAGAGAGACARHLAHALPDGSVTCLDIDWRWLEIARRRLARFAAAEFLAGDIARWSLPESFDAAVLHFVLHDIPAEDRPAALANIAASLRPGGVLFVREPTGHGMSAEELTALLDAAGFTLRAPTRLASVPLMGETIAGAWVRG